MIAAIDIPKQDIQERDRDDGGVQNRLSRSLADGSTVELSLWLASADDSTTAATGSASSVFFLRPKATPQLLARFASALLALVVVVGPGRTGSPMFAVTYVPVFDDVELVAAKGVREI